MEYKYLSEYKNSTKAISCSLHVFLMWDGVEIFDGNIDYKIICKGNWFYVILIWSRFEKNLYEALGRSH